VQQHPGGHLTDSEAMAALNDGARFLHAVLLATDCVMQVLPKRYIREMTVQDALLPDGLPSPRGRATGTTQRTNHRKRLRPAPTECEHR